MALKIVAVDDDPEVLKLIKSIVEPLGCEILILGDSLEAARRLEQERFDGIFVDALMPNMDGFELTKRIRGSSLNSATPIVMITGQADAETMRRGFKAGVTCFLGKPITWERLYTLVRAMRAPMLREKIRHVRLPYQTPVKCRTGLDSGQQFVSASTVISERGMLLGSGGKLETGQEVDLEFEMPDAPKPLHVRGKVLRQEPPHRVAVEFIRISDDDREVIRRYIAGNVTL